MRKFYWWFRHLGHEHYLVDLGEVVRTEQLPLGGLVHFRRCLLCPRIFVDFGIGLREEI